MVQHVFKSVTKTVPKYIDGRQWMRLLRGAKPSAKTLSLPYPSFIADMDAPLDKLFGDLISLPTTENDLAARIAGVKQVQSFLKSMGMDTHYLEFDAQPVLWATSVEGSKRPKVLLAAHIDVVNGPDEVFRLQSDEEHYYGRGVLDMKCAIAAYMEATRQLRSTLHELDFGILITSDEELGGKDGINAVEKLLAAGYAADFVVLPDGAENWAFEHRSKGYLHYTLSAHGTSGHGSRPWEAQNALHSIMDTLHELRDAFKDHGPDTSTLNIGMVRGGEAPNRIPNFASADIESRPIDTQAMGEIKHIITTICEQHNVEYTLRAEIEPLEHDFSNECLHRFIRTTEDVIGKPVTQFRSYAGSDARFFLKYNIPVAVFYPAGGGHHSDREWLDKQALVQLSEICKTYVKTYTRRTH